MEREKDKKKREKRECVHLSERDSIKLAVYSKEEKKF